jgi:pimeloyl-ACP methyl ester carboxylesterase
VVLCVHGLTRQGRDLDVLAQALCEQAQRSGQHPGGIRVVCPDMVGRGESDWLQDPTGYQVPAYAAAMLVLLARLQAQAPIKTLDWVGTSMGGLIGMVICGQPELSAARPPAVTPAPAPSPSGEALTFSLPLPVPVRKLVLNDVGPALQSQALTRIGAYLGKSGPFNTLQEAADAMWLISQGFGPHTPEQWLALTRPMLRPVTPGTDSPLRLHYDPAIAQGFKAVTQDAAQQSQDLLWELYDRITAQTLVLRGVASDLLSRETAQAMTQRGPHAQLVEFEGVGHAPTLIANDQVAAVAGFLLNDR